MAKSQEKPEIEKQEITTPADQQRIVNEMRQEHFVLSIRAETLESNCPAVAKFVEIMAQRNQLAQRINQLEKTD